MYHLDIAFRVALLTVGVYLIAETYHGIGKYIKGRRKRPVNSKKGG